MERPLTGQETEENQTSQESTSLVLQHMWRISMLANLICKPKSVVLSDICIKSDTVVISSDSLAEGEREKVIQHSAMLKPENEQSELRQELNEPENQLKNSELPVNSIPFHQLKLYHLNHHNSKHLMSPRLTLRSNWIQDVVIELIIHLVTMQG